MNLQTQRVSVIIPCFNGEKYLAQTLQSVRWQTYPHWECILVDDGSTDRSAEIFHSYTHGDTRFRYFRQANQGLAAARNSGLDLAEGGFIQFLDADDILLPDRLQCCVEQFRQYPQADIIYTDYANFNIKDGFTQALPAKIPYDDTMRAFLFHLDISFVVLVHSFFFRRNVIVANRFDPDLYSHGEDVECWIRIAQSGARFQYLDRVLSIYRYSTEALTRNEVKLFSSKLKTMERYRTHPKSIEYPEEYARAVQHFQERLAIAYFMEKLFSDGFRETKIVWQSATLKSKMKLVMWMVLMSFCTKNSVLRFRSWVFLRISNMIGIQTIHRYWEPPPQVDALLRGVNES